MSSMSHVCVRLANGCGHSVCGLDTHSQFVPMYMQVGTAQASSSSSGAGSSGRTTHTHSGDPKAIRFAESASGALAFLIDLRSGAVLIRRGKTTLYVQCEYYKVRLAVLHNTGMVVWVCLW